MPAQPQANPRKRPAAQALAANASKRRRRSGEDRSPNLKRISQLDSWIRKKGEMPKRHSSNKLEESLSQYLMKIARLYRAGSLQQEQVSKLKRIRFMKARMTAWDRNPQVKFEQRLKQLEKWIHDHHGRLPARNAAPASERSLATFLSHIQHIRHDLPKAQLRLLRRIAPDRVQSWRDFIPFERRLQELRRWTSRHKRLPSRTAQGEELSLARFLSRIQHGRNELTQAQLKKLKSISLQMRDRVEGWHDFMPIHRRLAALKRWIRRKGRLPTGKADDREERSLGVFLSRLQQDYCRQQLAAEHWRMLREMPHMRERTKQWQELRARKEEAIADPPPAAAPRRKSIGEVQREAGRRRRVPDICKEAWWEENARHEEVNQAHVTLVIRMALRGGVRQDPLRQIKQILHGDSADLSTATVTLRSGEVVSFKDVREAYQRLRSRSQKAAAPHPPPPDQQGAERLPRRRVRRALPPPASPAGAAGEDRGPTLSKFVEERPEEQEENEIQEDKLVKGKGDIVGIELQKPNRGAIEEREADTLSKSKSCVQEEEDGQDLEEEDEELGVDNDSKQAIMLCWREEEESTEEESRSAECLPIEEVQEEDNEEVVDEEEEILEEAAAAKVLIPSEGEAEGDRCQEEEEEEEEEVPSKDLSAPSGLRSAFRFKGAVPVVNVSFSTSKQVVIVTPVKDPSLFVSHGEVTQNQKCTNCGFRFSSRRRHQVQRGEDHIDLICGRCFKIPSPFRAKYAQKRAQRHLERERERKETPREGLRSHVRHGRLRVAG